MINKNLLECCGEEFNSIYANLIAHELINNTILIIGSSRYKIVEISFHYYSKDRKDYLSKKLNRQKNPKFHLILHETKGKGTVFYGIDLTFGKRGSYGGILIRQLQNCDDKDDKFFGASFVGNKLKEHFNNDKVSIDPFDEKSLVKFEVDKNIEPKIISSTMRYSYKLNINSKAKEEELKWLFDNLNFTTDIASCQTNWRLALAASLVLSKKKDGEITRILKLSPDRKRIIELIRQDTKKDFMKSILNLDYNNNDEELVKLYGSWLKKYSIPDSLKNQE